MATVLRTTNCTQYGHPEFRLTYDPKRVTVEDDAKWLVAWLEESVARGMTYLPGQTCQIGWSVTEVRQLDDGDLSIWESDMQNVPMAFIESVSHTLAHLRVQKDVVESVLTPDDMSFPSMCESALICTRLGRNAGVVMERSDPLGTDSGWYFGCREKDHDHNNADNLLRVSVYEAVVRYASKMLPYLALPSGILIDLTRGPVIFKDGEPLDFHPNSYLAARQHIE